MMRISIKDGELAFSVENEADRVLTMKAVAEIQE
jgi:hypothetical protein